MQDLNVPDDVLVTAQKNLFALKELLDTNPYLFHSAPGDHTGARSASVNEQEAWKVCSNLHLSGTPSAHDGFIGGANFCVTTTQSSRSDD